MEEKDFTSARTKLMWISCVLLVIVIGKWSISEVDILWMVKLTGVELFSLKYWTILLIIALYLRMRYQQFLKQNRADWKYWEALFSYYEREMNRGIRKIDKAVLFDDDFNTAWEYGECKFNTLRMNGDEYAVWIFKTEKNSPTTIMIPLSDISCQPESDMFVVHFKYFNTPKNGKGASLEKAKRMKWYLIIRLNSTGEKFKLAWRVFLYYFTNKVAWDQDFPANLNNVAILLYIANMIGRLWT